MASKAILRKSMLNFRAFSGRVFGVRRVPIVASTMSIIRQYSGGVEHQQRRIEEIEESLAKEADRLSEEGRKKVKGSLLSIQHHRSGGGEAGILKFITSSSVKTIDLPRSLDPNNLPRQAVEGVVCITTNHAFLLYNPTTGATSRWIETTATALPDLYGRKRQNQSIALGFDVVTKKHKVVCISSYLEKMFQTEDDADDDYFEDLITEVLTVEENLWTTGEHEWRELKELGPPDIKETHSTGENDFKTVSPPAFSNVRRFSFMSGPLSVSGKIQWLFQDKGEPGYLLQFQLATEDFKIALLPIHLDQGLTSYSLQFESMLMEIRNNVAILNSDQQTTTLWLCFSESISGKTFKWGKVKVLIPYAYLSPGSSIGALKGTSIIFIQLDDGSFYWNSWKTESPPHRILVSPIPGHLDWGRMIQL